MLRSLERALLAVGALAGLGLGLAILIAPSAFYAGYGIAPAGDIPLLNELKAAGGMIVLAALMIGAGLFRPDIALFSVGVGALLYLGFGLGRLAAMATDGLPPPSLVAVTLTELVVGSLFALALWRRRPLAGG